MSLLQYHYDHIDLAHLIRVLGVRKAQPWKDLIKASLLSRLDTFQSNKVLQSFTHETNAAFWVKSNNFCFHLLHQLTKFTEICFHYYSQQNLHIFNTELSLFSFWGWPLFFLQREDTCRKLFLVLIHSSLFTVIQNSCLYYKWLTFSSFWFRSLSFTSHLNYLSSSNF